MASLIRPAGQLNPTPPVSEVSGHIARPTGQSLSNIIALNVSTFESQKEKFSKLLLAERSISHI